MHIIRGLFEEIKKMTFGRNMDATFYIMDAIFNIKKLDISIFRPNLHSAKRIFENSGRIIKVWALSIFFNPEISFIRYSNPTTTGLLKPVLTI